MVYEKALFVLDSSPELNLEVEYPPLLRCVTMSQEGFMIEKEKEREENGGTNTFYIVR